MESPESTTNSSGLPTWLPAAAAIVALVGLGDAVYLTIHHYNAEPVPCGGPFDCEMVLTSPYATLGGLVHYLLSGIVEMPVGGDIPLSILGAVAYFVIFCLALLTAFGNRRMWTLYVIQATLMAIFTGWLVYAQYYLIHAWCQYCLLSAATTATLFVLFLVSLLVKRSKAS